MIRRHAKNLACARLQMHRESRAGVASAHERLHGAECAGKDVHLGSALRAHEIAVAAYFGQGGVAAV